MTAGVVHYYDQITIFPPPLLPPITAPNRFVSPKGFTARSGRTSFTTTVVIPTSCLTSTFSSITSTGVQFFESAIILPHLLTKLTHDSSQSTMRQLTVQLCALDISVRKKVYHLIQKYWSIFDNKGQFVPVKDYQCVINTGTARPICVKKIQYRPRETPIMRKCIAALAKLGRIRQMHNGEWMFKALLAPKPHQEHISNIADFVWRFCINYIPLKQVTRPIVYSIPRWDSAVNLTFGSGQWIWLWDAPSGYHQIGVSPCSQDKLAFAGPDATKWTYTVMLFGPVNGPPTFIAFIHDVDSTWKELVQENGIVIDEDTNTTIIVDNIFSYAKTMVTALLYMECQLHVAQLQNLSLSLKKSFIFPKQVEFVGVDVCQDGARMATDLLSPSISYSSTGLHQLLFAMLRNLLDSYNSIPDLSPTLRCIFRPFARS